LALYDGVVVEVADAGVGGSSGRVMVSICTRVRASELRTTYVRRNEEEDGDVI